MQEQLLAASAPLQEFLEECCDLDSRKGVHTVALHSIYKTWLKDTHPGETPLTDGDFADELRAAAPTITKKRAKKPDERLRDGCVIVETELDAKPDTRAYLWLGICPKPSYRKKKADAADDSLSFAPALPLTALTQLPVQSPVGDGA